MYLQTVFPEQTEKCIDRYRKCPKISFTKLSDKMAHANRSDWSSLFRIYTVCHSTKQFKEYMHNMQTLSQKSME